MVPLNTIPIGQKCKVKKINSTGLLRRRLLDLGLIYNTTVKPLHEGPFREPTAYLIRGAVIALRSEVSSAIIVERI